jgi:hypothetical protein
MNGGSFKNGQMIRQQQQLPSNFFSFLKKMPNDWEAAE